MRGGSKLAGLVMLVAALPCFGSRLEAAAVPKRAPANPLVENERLLMLGRVDDAVAGLKAALSANPADARIHLMLCRAFYAEEMADPAVQECEAALGTLGGDSTAQDWMGRAYGLKADRSGPLAGYKLASKVRVAFETAVQLDENNEAAVDDLSEYYVGAPAILGGGTDKAFALAARVETKLPRSAHRTRGLAAEKEHDFGTAEREFKAAVALGGRADAWTDLGHYYYRRQAGDQAVEALHHALDADRVHDASVVDVANILIKLKREPNVAEKALRDYLGSNAKSDGAPAFKVEVDLGKLLAGEGKKVAAEAEYANSLALAKDYVPAKRALQKM